MFEAYLWEEPSFGYASDDSIEVLEVLQKQCEDGIGETYFLIADREKGRFFRVNMRRFHTCYPSGTTDVEFQQDPAEHIKVQYHDEELTLRQLIDKLDEKTFECTRLKNIATAQKDEIIMLKRDLSAMEERLDG